ncbi:hypothetical protein B566_EDAN009915 [Ephemera danica]|nr:hypothetical protein B566_EDAN009915 [Ephemera danica]
MRIDIGTFLAQVARDCSCVDLAASQSIVRGVNLGTVFLTCLPRLHSCTKRDKNVQALLQQCNVIVLFLAAWLQPLTSASPSNRSLQIFPSAPSTSSSSSRLGVEIGDEEADFEEDLEHERGGGHGGGGEVDHKVYGLSFGNRMGIKQMQQMLMREGRGIECCPSKTETTTPDGGINRDGLHVLLFRNDKVEQTFYEESCLPGVEDKPCYFLDRRMHNQSRCVQKRSFSYAMVLNPAYSEDDLLAEGSIFSQDPSSFNISNSKWMMDYIQVNSGCACEVLPKHRKKKHDKSKKPKNKRIDS